MDDKLADFMVEMATDSTLKRLYQRNPTKLMEIYQIDENDIKLMLSKKPDLIRQRLGAEYEISFNSQITAFKVKS